MQTSPLFTSPKIICLRLRNRESTNALPQPRFSSQHAFTFRHRPCKVLFRGQDKRKMAFITPGVTARRESFPLRAHRRRGDGIFSRSWCELGDIFAPHNFVRDQPLLSKPSMLAHSKFSNRYDYYKLQRVTYLTASPIGKSLSYVWFFQAK